MDKVKEALFSILADGIRDALVLDLYAASGGLGLEALSRGAKRVVFVEKSRRASILLRENIRLLGLEEQTEIAVMDVQRYLVQSEFSATHVFCDPPYLTGLASETLSSLSSYPGLRKETVIIMEHALDEVLDIPSTFTLFKRKGYGDTQLSFICKNERRAN